MGLIIFISRFGAIMDFSRTAIKALKRLNKPQLVDQIMKMAEYAERQKAANIILLNTLEKLKQDRAAELSVAEGQVPNE